MRYVFTDPEKGMRFRVYDAAGVQVLYVAAADTATGEVERYARSGGKFIPGRGGKLMTVTETRPAPLRVVAIDPDAPYVDREARNTESAGDPCSEPGCSLPAAFVDRMGYVPYCYRHAEGRSTYPVYAPGNPAQAAVEMGLWPPPPDATGSGADEPVVVEASAAQKRELADRVGAKLNEMGGKAVWPIAAPDAVPPVVGPWDWDWVTDVGRGAATAADSAWGEAPVPAGVPAAPAAPSFRYAAEGRRRKVLFVPRRQILDWVKLVGRPDPAYVARPALTGLPPDTRLVDVRDEWDRNAFGFVLESAAFDPVPEGEAYPRYGGPFGVTYEMVRLMPKLDGGGGYPEATVKPVEGGWAVYAIDSRDTVVLGTFTRRDMADAFAAAVGGR